ncbi:MAG TPA: hypothetical protein VMR54_01200 [Thermoanaerobaculia bacterium]|nr:hypothetical protein [Thermoanaerobaculia bacterium]
MKSGAFPGILVFAVAALIQPNLSLATDGELQSSAPLVPSPAVSLKVPGPEAQHLMLGTWAIHVKYEPSAEMPNGGVGQGREVWRAGPGGGSVIEEYEEEGAAGEFHGLGVAWWDEKAQGQRFIWCASHDPGGCQLSKNVAKWEGNSLIYTEETEEKGKRLVRQEVFTNITPTSFTQILKAGPTASELKTTVTIQATRLKR